MNRLAKVCARYLGGHRGFSIGIEDVTPSEQVLYPRPYGRTPTLIANVFFFSFFFVTV